MRKLMHFLMRQESALQMCMFVVNKPFKPSSTCRLCLGANSTRKLCSSHGTSTILQPPSSSNRLKGAKYCILLLERRSELATLSQQRANHNKLAPSMLTRNINNLIAAASFGTNTKTVRQITMETSEKLVHSRCNKQIEFRACGPLYSELSKSRPILYSAAPKDKGILFKVQYYDSIDMLSNHSHEAPVVCLLHGSPGNYEEFASAINFLTIRGIRVVAPNFPDYNATYQYSFRHSPRERLDFLLEFFKAINVNKIDMLIGHSGAIYTMFELLEHSVSEDTSKWATTSKDFKVEVKSLGLFNTPSHRLPSSVAVTPVRLFTLKLFDYPIFRPIFLAVLTWWVKIQGIKNRVDKNKIEDLLISASTIGYSDCEKLAYRLDILKCHKIPTLLVYGAKDRLIDVYSFEQLERDLGITDKSRVKQYRGDGTVERDRSPGFSGGQQLVDVSRFEEGGHYAFQRYSNQVNEDVYDFLQKRVLADESQATRL